MKTARKSIFLLAVGKGAALTIILLALCITAGFAQTRSLGYQAVYADSVSVRNAVPLSNIIDYEFEEVPAEAVTLTAGVTNRVQPRQTFNLSYSLEPFWTTTSKVFYDVYPESAASVSHGGVVTVSEDALVGSAFSIIATADDSECAKSLPLEFLVVKIPVTGLTLNPDGPDSLLAVGKSRGVIPNIQPLFATCKNVRYEISGTGLEYVLSFNNTTGEVAARGDIISLNAGATVVVTAFAVDNESFSDSVVYTLHMPSVRVELTAETPLGGLTSDGKPLAVSGSSYSDTVTLRARINGNETSGLNYVILSGQSYVQNGYILPDGTFALRKGINVPRAEIKIMVAYSDGYDEVTVSVYVPIERISFKAAIPDTVENFRNYDLEAGAFPSYATYLADHAVPLEYTLNGLPLDIADVGLTNGYLRVLRSTVSFGTTISFTAFLPGSWLGVDVAPLNHSMYISPVYAENFSSAVVLKGGISIDAVTNKVYPNDNLSVEVVYDKDNVTHMPFTLSEDSNMLSVSGSNILISALSAMESDNPEISITVAYNYGGNYFSVTRSVWIYVPAEFAMLDGYLFNRETGKNLNIGLTINGHNYANNHTVTWETAAAVETVGGQTGITATVSPEGILSVTPKARAGTKLTVWYKTYDNAEPQSKLYEVAPLSGIFTVGYGTTAGYNINAEEPQLEEGQSVDLILKYNGVGAYTQFGVTFAVAYSPNAGLTVGSHYADRDLFTLTALSGQSGRSNYITYTITVYDGTAEPYIVQTDGLAARQVAIFNRISGSIGVSNTTIAVGGTFNLTGWDSYATYNQSDLVWDVSGGTLDSSHKILTAPNSGFILTVSFNQPYNGGGQTIPWNIQVTYVAVIYRNDDGSVRDKAFFKSGSSIPIDSPSASKTGYAQSGWTATALSTTKQYELSGSIYSGINDLSLYPHWVAITVINTIRGPGDNREHELGAFVGSETRYDDWKSLNVNLAFLRDAGFTRITITVSIDHKGGEAGGLFVEVKRDFDLYIRNNSGDGVKVGGITPSASSSWQTAAFSVTLNINSLISSYENTPQFRMSYKTYMPSGAFSVGRGWEQGASSISVTAS